jgi:hypothetical protein
MRESFRDFKTSESYSIEDRFMGIAASSLEPTVLSITPNKGTNNRTYTVIINGTNFAFGATVILRAAGKDDIIATLVTVESSGSMECTIDLNGAPVGKRDVIVTVPGGAGTLHNGFTIISPSLKLTDPRVYPNPFDPNTQIATIEYTLSKDAAINHYLFNQKGDVIWHKTCPAGDNGGAAGDNKVLWNGRSDFKEGVPTGVYVLIITARSGDKELTRIKIAVLRLK